MLHLFNIPEDLYHFPLLQDMRKSRSRPFFGKETGSLFFHYRLFTDSDLPRTSDLPDIDVTTVFRQ